MMQALSSTGGSLLYHAAVSSSPSSLLCLGAPLSYCAKSFSLSLLQDYASSHLYSSGARRVSDSATSQSGHVSDEKSNHKPSLDGLIQINADVHSSNALLSERLGLFTGHDTPKSSSPTPHLDISTTATPDFVPDSTASKLSTALMRGSLAVQAWQDTINDAGLYVGKAKNRVKGIGRKLLLRQVNKRIVARLARRATIGIPCFGFFLVSQVIVKDTKRVLEEMKLGNSLAASAFACAVVFEGADLLAQTLMISGLASANFQIGFAWLATYCAMADKWSLTLAALTCSTALLGELFALHDGMPDQHHHDNGRLHHQHQVHLSSTTSEVHDHIGK